MGTEQLNVKLQRIASIKSTSEWKRNITVNLTEQIFYDLYKDYCKGTQFDPEFIKVVGKNIDNIIEHIKELSNSQFKQLITRHVIIFNSDFRIYAR